MGSALGLTFAAEPPGVVAHFEPDDRHEGPPGHLHGGYAALALDEVMGALSWHVQRVRCVTGRLDVRYRKPVPLDGEPLRLEAWEERGGRYKRVRGRIVLADGTVAVEGKGLFVEVGSR